MIELFIYMARKVFISFLGINDYTEVHYSIGGRTSLLVRFVQEALIDHWCQDWNDDDRIIICCTEKSRKVNWFDYEGRTGLNTILQKKEIASIVAEPVLIKEGLSEHDLWDTFNVIYDNLKESDQVYFDITHAFRSIPIFATVLMNYARFMKNVEVKSIQYGAVEALGTIAEVKQMPEEMRVAPVIDLTSVIKLQYLTQAADNFLNFGKMGKLGSAIAGTEYSSVVVQTLKNLQKAVIQLEEILLLNQAHRLKGRGNHKLDVQLFDDLNQQLYRLLHSDELNLAEKEILSRLYDKVSRFGRNPNNNIEVAIKWAIEFDMISQAYTIGQENIKDRFLDLVNTHFNKHQTKFSHRITVIEGVLGLEDENKYDIRKNSEDIAVFKELYNLELSQKIRPSYILLKQNRNSLNHANSIKTISVYKEEFRDTYYNCIDLINAASEHKLR